MLIPFGVFSAAAAGGGAAAGAYELISSTILGSDTASVTFNITGLGSTYKHLQLRTAHRSTYATYTASIRLRLNSDTGANYAVHGLRGNGSTVTSFGGGDDDHLVHLNSPGANDSANIFGASVVDLLDVFSTSKNKTVRAISGQNASSNFIDLRSGVWRSTSAVTSISIFDNNSGNLKTGSRFSLYGLKGA